MTDQGTKCNSCAMKASTILLHVPSTVHVLLVVLCMTSGHWSDCMKMLDNTPPPPPSPPLINSEKMAHRNEMYNWCMDLAGPQARHSSTVRCPARSIIRSISYSCMLFSLNSSSSTGCSPPAALAVVHHQQHWL